METQQVGIHCGYNRFPFGFQGIITGVLHALGVVLSSVPSPLTSLLVPLGQHPACILQVYAWVHGWHVYLHGSDMEGWLVVSWSGLGPGSIVRFCGSH
jgi:hypothetical protein